MDVAEVKGSEPPTAVSENGHPHLSKRPHLVC